MNVSNKIKMIIYNFLFQAIAFAQVGWEDAAFGGGPHESGGEFGIFQLMFFLLGIIFFIWFVFFSDS